MATPKPFRVAVSDEAIEDLKNRLANTRYPDQLEDIGWRDGTELSYLKELVEYWQTRFDWRKQEALLNSFPQYTLPINSIDLHFIHITSPKPGAIPLLLIHGWPGSYFEFYKVIPLLQKQDMFHIVVPSLPGYGFSSAPKRRGFGVKEVAATLDALMAALGYSKYLAQGGDWGGITCRALARAHGSSCCGIHVNMCIASPTLINPVHLMQAANAYLLPQVPLLLTAREIKGLQDLQRFMKTGTGYQLIQGTKPQSLAYGLTDSPAGLAAWIVEKFSSWGDCKDYLPESAFTRDELLTNICIYWFTGCIASSIRLYKETLMNQSQMSFLLGRYSPTPAAVAMFHKEIIRPPRRWAAAKYNIVQWSEFDKGGHFAALELPEGLAADVVKFAERVWKQ